MAYFSNGSEGMVFDEQCSRCIFGERACPIALVQMDNNYSACNNEGARKILDALVHDDGTCAMYQEFPFEMDKGEPANDRPGLIHESLSGKLVAYYRAAKDYEGKPTKVEKTGFLKKVDEFWFAFTEEYDHDNNQQMVYPTELKTGRSSKPGHSINAAIKIINENIEIIRKVVGEHKGKPINRID